MIVGGNGKAAAFFRAHGVPDSYQGEVKYKSKASEEYKNKLSKMALELHNTKDKSQVSEKSTETVSLNSDQLFSQYQKENSKVAKNTVSHRLFDGFSDDEWEKDDFAPQEKEEIKPQPKQQPIEDKKNENDDLDLKRTPVRSSRFMYSDSISDSTFQEPKPDPKESLYNEQVFKENTIEDDSISRHDLFGDNKKTYNAPKSSYIPSKDHSLTPKMKSFENAKSISSKQYFEEEGFSNPSRHDPKLSKFSNSKSISSSDYHGHPQNHYDDDEIDLKEVGRAIVKTGKKFVDWLNELVDDE